MVGVSMGGAEILEPFVLDFSDLSLITRSNPGVSSSADQEMERLDFVSDRVMDALGPSGSGLLCVTGIPEVPALRRKLLPLARKLALLDNGNRARILKSHNLGSDVPLKNPDRAVSSFAKQLKYSEHPLLQWSSNLPREKQDLHDSDFNQLGNSFNLLASCMMELGLQLAKLCDRKIGGQEMESSLLNSGTAKGRLIHYHSRFDHLIIKNQKKRSKEPRMKPAEFHASLPQELQQETKDLEIFNASGTLSTDFWQHWHYDYGIFTVLTAPMFIYGTDECIPPDGHTCLQLFDCIKNKIFFVKAPPESFIVQVGESADILSKGKLRSTLHSVGRPSELGNLSRETFVVFLQPSWDKVLSTFDNASSSGAEFGNHGGDSGVESGLNKEIIKAIPPLCSRLRDGMTFAEFSRETTKQYYGGGGTQSKR